MDQNQNQSLVVRFYKRPWQNFTKSTLEGRPIFEDKDFVQIQIPGLQLTEIDTLAEEHHQLQYPVEWARYQNALNADDVKMEGTPLSAWASILPAVAENLKYYKFFTVEQIANATDSQLKAIDTICGTNAFHLRDQAKYYLASSKETADKVNDLMEKEELKQQNQDFRDQMTQVIARVDQLEKEKAQAAAELAAIKEKQAIAAEKKRLNAARARDRKKEKAMDLAVED